MSTDEARPDRPQTASPVALALATAHGKRALYALGGVAVLKACGLVLVADAIAGAVVGLAHGQTVTGSVVLGCIGALVRGLAVWLSRSVGARAAVGVKTALREALLRRETGGGGRDQKLPDGALALTATRALDDLDDYFTSVLPALTGSAAIPLLVGLRVLAADWVSALVLVVTLPLVPVFMVLIGKYTEGRVAESTRALDQLSTNLVELARGLPVLIGLGRVRAQTAALRDVSESYRATTMQTLRVAFLSALALELISTISVALVAVFIGVRLVVGDMALHAGLLALVLAPECFLPLRALGAAFHSTENGMAAYERVRRLIARPAAAVLGTRTSSASAPTTTAHTTTEPIDVTGLSVHYDGRSHPTAAPLTVRFSSPGLYVVAGPSGAGKSTVLNVLGGAIRDGAGVAVSGHISGLPDEIAQAGQNPQPYAPTVREELELYTQPDWAPAPAPEQMVELVASALHDAALDVPADRPCAALSPGELRRLALARAFIQVARGARLLLVDEPTAHLDAVSADTVRRTLRRLATRITVIAATHDPQISATAQVVRLDPYVTGPCPADMGAGEAAPTDAVPNESMPDESAPSDAAATEVAATEVAATGHTAEPDAASPAKERPGRRPAQHDAPLPMRDLLARLATAVDLRSPRFTLAVLCGVAAVAAGAALTGVSAWLIVYASAQPPIMYLMVAIVGVRFFGLSRSALTYAKQLNLHDAVLRSLTGLRERLWKSFARTGTANRALLRGDVALRRLVSDVDDIRDLAPRVILPPVVAAVIAVAAIVALGLIAWPAALVMACGVVIMCLLAPALALRADANAATVRLRQRAGVLARTTELLAARADLIGGRVDGRAVDQVVTGDRRAAAAESRSVRATGVGESIVTAAGVMTSMAMVVTLGPAVTAGNLPPALLAVTVLLPLSTIDCFIDSLSAVQQWPALARVLATVPELRRPESAADDGERPVTDRVGESLELAELSAGWDGTPVFTGLNLKAQAGGWTVLTGPSGSGKTTVVSVILRFLDPLSGEYRIDGRDALGLHPEQLAGTVAWCPQESHVFDSSLRNNLAIARPKDEAPSTAELEAVLGRVGLDSLVREIGLDAKIGAEGSALSGGQRQRLAVARTLLADARIVVLDEPTAHLDEDLTQRLMADLRGGLADRTVVHVTHETALVARIDRHVRL